MATINLKAFPAPENVICPSCQQETKLYDPNGSEFYVCISCCSFLQFNTDNDAVVQTQTNKVTVKPVLPLGSEGILKGTPFKVIAYLQKKEKGTKYTWREYVLYNYEKGYATLSEYDGHWSLVTGKEFIPELEKLVNNNLNYVDFDNIEYALFNKYRAVVTSLIGEFDWDPLTDEVKTSEFIAPPFIIYREQDSQGTQRAIHYLGEYTEPEEIAEAFKLDINLFPPKKGVGANQFSKPLIRWNTVYQFTLILLAILVIIQAMTMTLKPEKVLMSEYFSISRDTTKTTNDLKDFATPSFVIEERSAAVEFELKSFVDNNWMEATIVLVNEKTNETWEVTEGIEYYHGYEDGTSWSEGSQNATVLLSSIPEGRYHLNVFPASGNETENNIHIMIKANVTTWMNFIISCLLLCLYPLYCWYQMRNFEKERWFNSDYSPYEEEE